MVYTAESDPLCYSGTTVLINKADITDPDKLEQFELAMTLTRAEEDWPVGSLDYSHYCALHHHIFQDVYDWAGQPRTIRVGKGGNWFCYPEYIENEMERIFTVLADQGFLTGLSPEEFVVQAAHILAEINAAHPFREGNGRTQLAFLMILAENAGLSVDEDKLDQDRVIEAMIESFVGNENALSNLITELIS